MSDSDDVVLSWGSSISDDGNNNNGVTLPPGSYRFKVMSYQRKDFPGSAKMEACPYAEIMLEVDGGLLGKTTMFDRLYLLTRYQWKIFQFFNSIDLMRKGEKKCPPWDSMPGLEGVLSITNRTYIGRDGETHSGQNIKYLPPESNATGPDHPVEQQPEGDLEDEDY